jgi:hypothetical protein
MVEKSYVIYKKFAKYIPLNQMSGLQWFALTKDYGSSTYGDIAKEYYFKKTPNLLDIGNANVRSMIKQTIQPFDPLIVEYSDPNNQYSGGVMNKKYHNLVKEYFGNEYDGTIIDETKLQGNNEYLKEDLEGPSEIVLWDNYTDLLDEVKNGGRKTRTTKRIKRRTKTRKLIKRRTKSKNKIFH